jgi:N-acetylglutamate synthase-like GNAT family acetyltransferase
MEGGNLRVRRATVDDLPQLRTLWQAQLPDVAGLERRVTEFQVVESPEGQILAAVALAMEQGHGLVHSEVFSDFAGADHYRALLWERLEQVARNHGLYRVWTREEAPFWARCGMHLAEETVLAQLPEPWRALKGRWLTLQLREPPPEGLSIEKEFELFMQAERMRTQALLERARWIKKVATLIALILAVLVLGAAWYLLQRRPGGVGVP